MPSVLSVTVAHGRRARRTIKVALAPSWIGFAGAAQVAQLRCAVIRNGTKTIEVVYLITRDRDASPETLTVWFRSHREIDNRLHWVRDVTGNAPASWRRCATWPSASCAWMATRTSPPPTATTPATRSRR